MTSTRLGELVRVATPVSVKAGGDETTAVGEGARVADGTSGGNAVATAAYAVAAMSGVGSGGGDSEHAAIKTIAATDP